MKHNIYEFHKIYLNLIVTVACRPVDIHIVYKENNNYGDARF